MGVIFESDSGVLWEPSQRIAQLFVMQLRGLEHVFGLSAGVSDIVADESRVDISVLRHFVARVAFEFTDTTNASLRSLTGGVFAVAAGILSMDDPETIESLQGDARILAQRGAILVSGQRRTNDLFFFK